MDACVRIRGLPNRTRSSIRKETVRDSGAHRAKSLLRSKKELCSLGLELQPPGDGTRLTEIHFVCLPSHCEGEDVTLQALSLLPGELCELLRPLHIHSLRNDEVLLLRDSSRRLIVRKDSLAQGIILSFPPGGAWKRIYSSCWLKAVCVVRHGPAPGSAPGPHAAMAASLASLLGRFAAGVCYALELQALQRGSTEAGQADEDDTNRSVSSIEDDFVTALEHLEEEEEEEEEEEAAVGDSASAAAPCHLGNKRDVASQTVPAHRRQKDLSGSCVIISSSTKASSARRRSGPDVSVTVQRSSGADSQWTHRSPGGARMPSASAHVSDSEESDCSSPSPIIFLDEVGYQKSLLATLDIPQVPGGPIDRVEDSDSEVSEFFDSFDQFDDLVEPSSEGCALTLPLEPSGASTTSGIGPWKYVSRGCSTRGMNPHRFDQPSLPANVKKPTPLKPGSPYSPQSEGPDSPRPVRTSCEENGGPLFSPVSSSAFSPLGESGGPLEYFWKADGQESSELRKPQDLCSLYKTYSDFASSLSKEILGSVCGYQSAVDISDNKNLSCVCHKEFQNTSGHLLKLSEIQEAVTASKVQRTSQSLKDGIQRFASDLVEMSLGSALRDLQKGVSSCTTTLCHLAARLTSSVFQMAFHEIGMRRACVLKGRAVNGLAGFLVGEAVSGALKDFLTVKKQIFHGTVTRFAADLAEELVFEGMMEVCQFSHPSTPLTPIDWCFGRGLDEEEEGEGASVTSYASDLSESVLQEAFIELSQADVTFTSKAAISVSLDNICYVSAEDTSTHTSSTLVGQQVSHAAAASIAPGPSGGDGAGGCTMKKALFTVSGMASCVPVPQAGRALTGVQPSEETAVAHPATQNDANGAHRTQGSAEEPSEGVPKFPFHTFSGNMVDMIVSEACELITANKMRKGLGNCADLLTKTAGSRRGSSSQPGSASDEAPDSPSKQGGAGESFGFDSKDSQGLVAERDRPQGSERGSRESVPRTGAHAAAMTTLAVPGGRGKTFDREEVVSAPGSGHKSGGTPGTPPSTPQQPSEVSQERQIRRFSKKLKGKLAKEFSPATPPPTPYYQPEPGPGPEESTPDAEKADFMLKLMRSLSEEAEGNKEEEEEEEEVEEEEERDACRGPEAADRQTETNPASARRMSNKEAFCYAERLACHIVSMATEMDTLGGPEEERAAGRRDSVAAQFSEKTLNSLWVYAGEVAGGVVRDVTRMMGSGQQCSCPGALHRRRRRRRRSSLERPHEPSQGVGPDPDKNPDRRLGRFAECWSGDLLASSIRPRASGSSSGLSSGEFPSCESVTDEYAGYLIRVLKKEGGGRELVLDQYASRLAYRSIKLGLAHTARKAKQRPSAGRLRPSKSLPDAWKEDEEAALPGDRVGTEEEPRCACGSSEEQSNRDYVALVSFAESLAYNVTRDVARKLRLSSVHLPKSLTDSCLYKKSKLEDLMSENLMRSSFSCPLLADEGRRRHYHSTGSLHDGGYSGGVMQVIEHYARKIVDDTLEMGLASAGHPAREHHRAQGQDRRHTHAEKLSEGSSTLGSGLGGRTCRHCELRECLYCTRPSGQHHQRRKGQEAKPRSGSERPGGMEIPKIHIVLDRRAAFAEEMVSTAMETAKRELSNTSLNADSGIGHDGASYAESLTAEIMTSALSNVCQAASLSSPRRETSESTVSRQLSLSVGEDSLGSWSNLSFEDDHPDDNSSFLHLSDSSNGNSSSWSSLGLEGEMCEERLSFSPIDSDCTGDKETEEVKEESSGTLCVNGVQTQAPSTLLVVVNTDVREPCHHRETPRTTIPLDPQLRSMLQWAAASMAGLPQVLLRPERELQQLPLVVQRLREREWRVGELLQALVRYCEETQGQGHAPPRDEASRAGRGLAAVPLFQWLLEHS